MAVREWLVCSYLYRITFNTSNMLLVLNFEKLEYDYTLEDDKMPSLVKYSKYSDAKVPCNFF